jgi:hypothetical protein
MYVRDLQDGMLVKPAEHYRWQLRPLQNKRLVNNSRVHDHSDGASELKESGIHYHVSPIYRSNWSTVTNDIAVYLGVKKIKNHYFGVKKQHMLLIDGTVAVVDGYQFKDIEKV